MLRRPVRFPLSVISESLPLLVVAPVATTFAKILQGYPDLEREDIQQALEYEAWLTPEEVRVP